MKNKIKNLISLILVFCCFTCFIRGGLMAFTDENDLISGEGAQIGGAPGNGSYMNVYCMWKISVYVGKSDRLAVSSDTPGFDGILGTQNLSEDYYKFGNTFYLYRDPDRGAGLAAQNYSADKIFLTVRDKEWYVRNLAAYIRGDIGPADYFKQGTLKELSGIVFDGSQNGLTGSLSVPDVPLFGGNSESALSFFSSAKVSDVLIQMAAESTGATVNELLASKEFTVNGRTASGSEWGFNMLTAIRGTDGIHTSCVPWVIEYEPVLTVQLKNTGHAMALTATEIGVAMICGRYNFTSNQNNVDVIFRPSEADLKAKVCDTYLTMGLAALFQNLPASAYVSKGWFGYPDLSEMPAVESHGATAARYVTDQIKAGGVGLRYQVSEAELLKITKTVSSEGPGSEVSDLGGFVFTITAVSGNGNAAGEVYKAVTGNDGTAEIRLRRGTYRITEENGGNGFIPVEVTSASGRVIKLADNDHLLTIGEAPNEVSAVNAYRTGTLRIVKESDTDDFAGLFFTVTGLDTPNGRINITLDASGNTVNGLGAVAYGSGGTEMLILGLGSLYPQALSVSVAESRVNGRYRRDIVLSGMPVGNYMVKEVIAGDRDRFLGTYVGCDLSVKSLESQANIQGPGAEDTVEFYNSGRIDTKTEIVKYASDGDFSETYFCFSGDHFGSPVEFYVDSSGNICPDMFHVDTDSGEYEALTVNGSFVTERLTVSAEDLNSDGTLLRKITVEGLPAGTWTVKEIVGGKKTRYSSVSSEYEGVTLEGTSREISAEPGSTAVLKFYNVKKIKLTVSFLDKYDHAKGIRTSISDSLVFEIESGREYDVRYLLSEYDRIDGTEDHYFNYQGFVMGGVYGDPLFGTAGESDLSTDLTYGHFHVITVHYRDKYTGEVLYTEKIIYE